MKTPEEIKKDAETCMNHPHTYSCNSCSLYSECHGIAEHIIKEVYDLVVSYESRLAQVERERDAAVQIVHGLCLHCKNGLGEGETCRECLYYPHRFVYGTGDKYVDNWQWRGVCEENTKEEGK